MAYKGVVVQKIAPDGLVIGYTMTDGGLGIAKLKFKDLSDHLQQQFGYDSTNAVAFEKEQKHAESEWQAKWTADDEKAKAKHQDEEIAAAEADVLARGGWVGTLLIPIQRPAAQDFSSRIMDICLPVFMW